jgi:hypothetical protein
MRKTGTKITDNTLKNRFNWFGFSLDNDQAVSLFIASLVFIYIELRYLILYIARIGYRLNYLYIPTGPGRWVGHIFTDNIFHGVLVTILLFLIYTIYVLNHHKNIKPEKPIRFKQERESFQCFAKEISQNQAIVILFISFICLIISLPAVVHQIFVIFIPIIFTAFISPWLIFKILSPDGIFNIYLIRYFLVFFSIFFISLTCLKDIKTFSIFSQIRKKII